MDKRSYENKILKALGLFKHVRNWPDLNGNLTNLLEIFSSQPDVDYVPHKILFAKTLAQCLSPALPSGIQSKALEVYQKIFEINGSDKNIKDFYIWCPGIFQFFHSAGVIQRVATLKIFSDFFLPLVELNPHIAPPLLLAVLPGLVDEGADVKTNTNQLINQIQSCLPTHTFWHALFRAALTNPATRSPFLILAATTDPAIIMDKNDPALTRSMFSAIFHDQNILVVRSALELFLSCFQLIDSDSKDVLGLEALSLLEIDDQSIRRRVFNWISAYTNDVSNIVHNASIESIKVMLKKGKEYSQIVEQNIKKIICRKNIEISSITNYLDPTTVARAAIEFPSTLVTLLPIITLTEDVQNEILEAQIDQILTVENIEQANIASRIGDFVVDSADPKLYDKAYKAVDKIFNIFKSDEFVLSFASKLIKKFDLEPSFEKLIEAPTNPVAIHTLLRMSEDNLNALIVADNSVYECIKCCIDELTNTKRSISILEICAALYKMNKRYPAQLAIAFSKDISKEAILVYIKNVSEIPASILIVLMNKNDYDITQMLAFYAIKVLNDAKNNITLEDETFSKQVIHSLSKLVQTEPQMFVEAVPDQTLVDLVLFLIKYPNTGNLICRITEQMQQPQLFKISNAICECVIKNPSNTSIYCILPNLASCDLPMVELINCLTTTMSIVPTLIRIMRKQKASPNHLKMLGYLIETVLASIEDFNGPILFEIYQLVMTCTEFAVAEVNQLRLQHRGTGLMRLITAVEDISPDPCTAILTVNTTPEAASPYAALVLKYIPKIIGVIRSEDASLVSSFYSRFGEKWALLLFHAIATGEGLQIPKIVSALLINYRDQQLIQIMKNLIHVLSYDEKFDRKALCAFIECAITTRRQEFFTQEFMDILLSIINTLGLSSLLIVRTILLYSSAASNIPLQPLQAPLTRALADIKSPAEVNNILLLINSIAPIVIMQIYGNNAIPLALMKFASSCNHSSPLYPQFLGQFGRSDAEGFSFYEHVFNLIADPNLFKNSREYIENVISAVKAIAADSERFTMLFFEKYSSVSAPIIFKMPKEEAALKNLEMLAFVMFASPPDTFKERQQNINAHLMHALAPNENQIGQFKTFALFMKVLFLRTPKLVESFTPILVHELTKALTGTNNEINTEARKLLDSALQMIPAQFQFSEFAFFNDSLTFDGLPENTPWPLLPEEDGTKAHLSEHQQTKAIEHLILLDFLQ